MHPPFKKKKKKNPTVDRFGAWAQTPNYFQILSNLFHNPLCPRRVGHNVWELWKGTIFFQTALMTPCKHFLILPIFSFLDFQNQISEGISWTRRQFLFLSCLLLQSGCAAGAHVHLCQPEKSCKRVPFGGSLQYRFLQRNMLAWASGKFLMSWNWTLHKTSVLENGNTFKKFQIQAMKSNL